MLVSVNENDPTPIYLQIVRQIKEQVLVGELRPDEELPSVRDLGDALGISLHTARSAYQALSDEGLLRIRIGRNARIAARFGGEPKMALRESDGEAVALRVREIVVDAMLSGLDREGIHELVDGEVDRLVARRAEAETSAA